MDYYTSEELITRKQEINDLLSTNIDSEIKRIKNTAEFKRHNTNSYNLLGICQEILENYKPVDETTDGIINNIDETNLQTIVNKVYSHFFTLKYPR